MHAEWSLLRDCLTEYLAAHTNILVFSVDYEDRKSQEDMSGLMVTFDTVINSQAGFYRSFRWEMSTL